jgi:hypothetical protein
MTPLSPAAQAVLDAVCKNTEPDCDTQHLIAAVLRVAADRAMDLIPDICRPQYMKGIESASDFLMSIAAELEEPMAELSPAARAVLDAYCTHADLLNREVSLEEMLAAALRELEKQLAQECIKKNRHSQALGDSAEPLHLDIQRAVLTERIRLFRRILAVAAELASG